MLNAITLSNQTDNTGLMRAIGKTHWTLLPYLVISTFAWSGLRSGKIKHRKTASSPLVTKHNEAMVKVSNKQPGFCDICHSLEGRRLTGNTFVLGRKSWCLLDTDPLLSAFSDSLLSPLKKINKQEHWTIPRSSHFKPTEDQARKGTHPLRKGWGRKERKTVYSRGDCQCVANGWGHTSREED